MKLKTNRSYWNLKYHVFRTSIYFFFNERGFIACFTLIWNQIMENEIKLENNILETKN